ncbi:MAG: DUF4331 family protein [Chthoniobacterales bacterium]
MKKIRSLLFPTLAFSFLVVLAARNISAADHGDSPAASADEMADINDAYLFLDPNDNNRVIIEMTVRGFIVPSEAVNMGFFDPNVVYRFMLESTGDAVPDGSITVTFAPRPNTSVGQTATVTMVQGGTTVFQFIAPSTAPTLTSAPPPRIVTLDTKSDVRFFAGEVDDPFFFDIPGFNRFVASVLAGTPNPSVFNRARDSFSGYNTMAIALSIPKPLVPQSNNVVGMFAQTLRAEHGALAGNLSTRGRVEGGDNVLISGLIIAGNTPKQILWRAIGPSLAGAVNGALANPKLTLFDSQGHVIAANDDWQESQATEIAQTTIAPSNPKESAILATLSPGAYTAITSSADGGSGIALAEVYDLEAANGGLRVVDRTATPAVNVALIPFARKDEYNTASPQDDAAGRFAGDIVGTLKALGTNDANIAILASVAVTNGDYLRLDLSKGNSGPGGGNSGTGFPNGRRLGDDVIDTLLYFITNQSPIRDNVNGNDVALNDTFPFFGNAQQPRDNGVIDDNTRN